jgi:hypothetical protein
MREGLNRAVVLITGPQGKGSYAQGGSLWAILETSRAALDNERGRVHTSTAYIGEHAKVVSDAVDREVPLAIRSSSW